MKKLSLSLPTIVLGSIILLGWGLDKIFEQYYARDEHDPIEIVQSIGAQFAASLNTVDALVPAINEWNSTNLVTHAELTTYVDFPLPEELHQRLKLGESIVLESDTHYSIIYWLKKHDQILILNLDTKVKPDDESITPILFTITFYTILLLLIFIWLGPLIKSLKNLKQQATLFGQGDLSARVKSASVSYITEIEQSFNFMAEKIETLINDNKLISSAVSHDLRTPIARLRFGIDLLEDTSDPEERIKHQQHISEDIDEMQNLVEALLHFSRLEQNMLQLKKETLCLNDLVERQTIGFESHNINVTFKVGQSNLMIAGHETYLNMLFHNLLANAEKYGRGNILVEIQKKGKLVAVSIHDNGKHKSMSNAEFSDLFKPFIRGKNPEKTDGFGLGLAICQRVAQWHRGSIEVKNSTQLSGFEFTVLLALESK
jgi:two-component system OmpR family sensor kinase